MSVRGLSRLRTLTVGQSFLMRRSLPLLNFGKEANIKWISVASKGEEDGAAADFAAATQKVNEEFAKQISAAAAEGEEKGPGPQFTEAMSRMFNLGPMEGMSKAEAKAVTEGALSGISDTDPHKYFKADPTRFGDWEKNGVCWDF